MNCYVCGAYVRDGFSLRDHLHEHHPGHGGKHAGVSLLMQIHKPHSTIRQGTQIARRVNTLPLVQRWCYARTLGHTNLHTLPHRKNGHFNLSTMRVNTEQRSFGCNVPYMSGLFRKILPACNTRQVLRVGDVVHHISIHPMGHSHITTQVFSGFPRNPQ